MKCQSQLQGLFGLSAETDSRSALEMEAWRQSCLPCKATVKTRKEKPSCVTWGLIGWVFIKMLFFPKGIHHFQPGFILVS